MGGPQGPQPGFEYRQENPEPQVISGGASTGMAVHKAEGIVPADKNCATDLPGLFAAGDALSSMLCGGKYAGIGMSFSGSAVQGYRAGKAAARYAKQAESLQVNGDRLTRLRKKIFAPLGKTKGFSAAWTTQMLQAATFPYYILFIKREDRLQGALANVCFLAEHCVPRLYANDLHELRLVHETGNMILNAEMKLRISLFRRESRGMHFREDFPFRDDTDFLAWIHVYQNPEGAMEIQKVLLPEKWRPPRELSYEERYPQRFPGELDCLNRQAEKGQ